MYFKALKCLLQLDTGLIDVFNEEMLNLHRGQSLDLYWRENLCCPSEEEYVNMVMNSEYTENIFIWIEARLTLDRNWWIV